MMADVACFCGSIEPCRICAIQSRQDFATDSPWRGDGRELRQMVEHLKVLRSQWGLDVEAAQAASPTRDRKRTSLLGALSAMRRSWEYIPPTASDYFS